MAVNEVIKKRAIDILREWPNVTCRDICTIIDQICDCYSTNNENEAFLIKELHSWKAALKDER